MPKPPVLSFFPTTIWNAKLKVGDSEFNRELLRECYAFRELDDAGRRWSRENYAAGYTSYSSIADLHERSTRFEKLKKSIDREVVAYARTLDLDLRGKKLAISSFWINIMGEHGHHSFHLHPLSAISGTYYLQTPRGSGSFKIEDPRIASFMGSPPRKARARTENRRYIDLHCEAGSLLLFESWLKHEVPVNRAKTDRVSVSFNYDWV